MNELQQIKTMDKAFITPAEAASVIGCNAHYIRIAAREHPEYLGFPCTIIGNRVKIPRLPFIKYVEDGAVWPCMEKEASA